MEQSRVMAEETAGRGRDGAEAVLRLPQPFVIGAEIAEHRRALAHLGAALAAAMPAGHDGKVRAALNDLRTRTARIAVVGRPGSRAPELLAALAQQPGLLPAEPPAKSAIVTTLHFARAGGPRGGAYAHYFDNLAWAQIAEGAGRLRDDLETPERAALSARLARQVEEMRTRAYMRLGDRFHPLLGEGERIAEITPAVMARYLGADAAAQGRRIAERARYADITREIEIFLGAGPFVVPASLVGTPGIDESFEVREERTAECLAEADLCIAVLGAEDGLSDADRRVLEALSARKPGRVVVVLSREEAAPETAPETASTHRPGAGHGREARAEAAHLVGVGQASRALAALASAGTGDDADAALRALHRSGLPGLAAALNDRLFWGPALDAHDAVAAALEAAARREIEALERDIAIITAQRDALAKAPDGGLEGLKADHEAAIAAAGEAGRGALEAAIGGLWAELRSEAIKALRAQAEAAAAEGPGAAGEAGLGQRIAADGARLVAAHRRALAGALATGSTALDHALEAAGVEAAGLTPDACLARVGVEEAALVAPLAAVRLPEGRRPRRPEELQRQLMVPFVPVVEQMVETATLELSRAAREGWEAIQSEARARIGRLTEATGRADRLESLAGTIAGIEAAADRIAAFRRASRGEGR